MCSCRDVVRFLCEGAPFLLVFRLYAKLSQRSPGGSFVLMNERESSIDRLICLLGVKNEQEGKNVCLILYFCKICVKFCTNLFLGTECVMTAELDSAICLNPLHPWT